MKHLIMCLAALVSLALTNIAQAQEEKPVTIYLYRNY